jgi:hypothetical protein
MLGWHISVYRQRDGGAAPATETSPEGPRLAVWQTGLWGLQWIDALVAAGKAIDLGGNGYPCRYTATAEHLVPPIMEGPPQARATWLHDASDILTDKWEGQTVIDRAVADGCRPDEWLLVVAWDES